MSTWWQCVQLSGRHCSSVMSWAWQQCLVSSPFIWPHPSTQFLGMCPFSSFCVAVETNKQHRGQQNCLTESNDQQLFWSHLLVHGCRFCRWCCSSGFICFSVNTDFYSWLWINQTQIKGNGYVSSTCTVSVSKSFSGLSFHPRIVQHMHMSLFVSQVHSWKSAGGGGVGWFPLIALITDAVTTIASISDECEQSRWTRRKTDYAWHGWIRERSTGGEEIKKWRQ